MKKIYLILLCIGGLVSGCAKHDPILPGVRHDVFGNDDVVVLNNELPELSDTIKNISGDENCDFSQDSANNIWSGKDKIFSGFAMGAFVKSNQSPICDGQFIYTGLSTGEAIKVNTKNKKVIWTTDVFKENSLTGGTPVVDIVAHVGLDKNFVYVGGLGDAFCKLNKNNGNKVWCVNISVPVDFIMVDNFAFVVGSDNNLYAINTENGKVYWKAEIKKQVQPKYNGKFLIVGKQKINYKTGNLI